MDEQTVLQNYQTFMARLTHLDPSVANVVASSLAVAAENETVDTTWQTYQDFMAMLRHLPPGVASGVSATLAGAVHQAGTGAPGQPPDLSEYVLKAGDTMTGDLWVTNPAAGTGAIRLAADQGIARVRLRKNDVGQWMIEGDDSHFRIINYTPDGTAKGEPLIIEPDNRAVFLKPQMRSDPVDGDDLVRNSWVGAKLDEKLNTNGSNVMTGFLQTTMVQIINSADAVLRLSGPDAAFVSFRRGGLALEPTWWLGTQHRVGTLHEESLCAVRFPDPTDVNSGDIPFEIRYDTGQCLVAQDPVDPLGVVTKRYVDGLLAPLQARIAQLESELAALKGS